MSLTDEWKTAIAVWGALTGTIGATIAILNAMRDRSRVRMAIDELSSEEAKKICTELAQIRSEKFVFAEVINVGRRVRYVYRPELWVADDHLLIPEAVDIIFADGVWSKPSQTWESWRLEEGQSVTFVFGEPEKYRIVRVDLPDSLARTRKAYYRPLTGRLRWHYGRWKGGRIWKPMRDLAVDRSRTRHHKKD
jgi:hypothetical protein